MMGLERGDGRVRAEVWGSLSSRHRVLARGHGAFEEEVSELLRGKPSLRLRGQSQRLPEGTAGAR